MLDDVLERSRELALSTHKLLITQQKQDFSLESVRKEIQVKKLNENIQACQNLLDNFIANRDTLKSLHLDSMHESLKKVSIVDILTIYTDNHNSVNEPFLEYSRLNMQTRHLRYPLAYISEFGQLHLISVLIFLGADVNMMSDEGETALLAAAMNNHIMSSMVLLSYGADPFLAKDVFHCSALWALPNIISVFYNLGLDINSKSNKFKESPLSLAVFLAYDECCEKLLRYGANVNYQNEEGETALHKAVYSQSNECIRKLLQAGADEMIADNAGMYPKTYAEIQGKESIIALFKQSS